MKRIVVIVSLALVFLAGVYAGKWNARKEIASLRMLNDATTEMLWQYWKYLDVEIDEQGDTISSGCFMLDVIQETDAFATADSIRGGNWDDFFQIGE